MKNWFKKKIRKWYFKYCEPDIVAMTRIQMSGVGPEIVWGDMSEEERDLLVANTETLMNNTAFHVIIDHVISAQRNYAINLSTDWEEVKFARGQISGASLVREIVEKISSMAEKGDVEFNPYEVI